VSAAGWIPTPDAVTHEGAAAACSARGATLGLPRTGYENSLVAPGRGPGRGVAGLPARADRRSRGRATSAPQPRACPPPRGRTRRVRPRGPANRLPPFGSPSGVHDRGARARPAPSAWLVSGRRVLARATAVPARRARPGHPSPHAAAIWPLSGGRRHGRRAGAARAQGALTAANPSPFSRPTKGARRSSGRSTFPAGRSAGPDRCPGVVSRAR